MLHSCRHLLQLDFSSICLPAGKLCCRHCWSACDMHIRRLHGTTQAVPVLCQQLALQ